MFPPKPFDYLQGLDAFRFFCAVCTVACLILHAMHIFFLISSMSLRRSASLLSLALVQLLLLRRGWFGKEDRYAQLVCAGFRCSTPSSSTNCTRSTALTCVTYCTPSSDSSAELESELLLCATRRALPVLAIAKDRRYAAARTRSYLSAYLF